mgnify:CR=1 FL=1
MDTSPHWRVVRELVEEHALDRSIVAIAVFGSLASGTERPDSDVDIEFFSSTASEWSIEEYPHSGLAVNAETTPLAFFEHKIEQYPFLCYAHFRSIPVFDPSGYFNRKHGAIGRYFGERPDVVAFWEERYQVMRREKAQGIKNPQGGVEAYDEAERRFSAQGRVTRDFWRSV